MFFLSGKIVQRIEGAKAADVTKAVKSLAKVQPTPRSNNQSAKEAKIETPEELNERLKKIIGKVPFNRKARSKAVCIGLCKSFCLQVLFHCVSKTYDILKAHTLGSSKMVKWAYITQKLTKIQGIT